ncbi:NAD-dependent epimerase/dehydratase family protein [Chloroflexota bacterium]
MTVVVTGATGHVGANLVRALISQRRPTRALIHVDRQAIEGLDIEVAEGDVRDPESLFQAFDGADAVYHLAADIPLLKEDWPSLESTNITGTRNVIEACLRRGVRRLVHFSSIHAITQEPLNTEVNESRLLAESRSNQPYGRSKAAGEREVCRGIEMGLDAIIISPTAVIGPHDYKPSYFGQALLALAQGKLPALVASGFDWVDVRDVVAGALRAEEQAPSGAKYLLSGHWASLHDLAKQVEEITSIPAPGFLCPLWLAKIGAPLTSAFNRLAGKQSLYTSVSLGALHCNKNISHAKAAGDLDYHPRPFRETLLDTLRWFEETGRLTHSNEATLEDPL